MFVGLMVPYNSVTNCYYKKSIAHENACYTHSHGNSGCGIIGFGARGDGVFAGVFNWSFGVGS